MNTPKKTKFRAILKLEEAIQNMYEVGFLSVEIREIVRDMTKLSKVPLKTGI